MSTAERRGSGLALAMSTPTATVHLIAPTDFQPPTEFGRELLTLLTAIHQRRVDATVDIAKAA
ncbi:MAG: hypothetical protein NVV70_03835 [Cellulomonas sp.]|nr:hypothetical protein [Cellulomonas sp.]MCR6647299.1 hypothetical protein [Cellulomonas sp.]